VNILCEMSLLQIRWDMSAAELHNFIRGNDKVPGAWAVIDNQVPHSTSVAVFFTFDLSSYIRVAQKTGTYMLIIDICSFMVYALKSLGWEPGATDVTEIKEYQFLCFCCRRKMISEIKP